MGVFVFTVKYVAQDYFCKYCCEANREKYRKMHVCTMYYVGVEKPGFFYRII